MPPTSLWRWFSRRASSPIRKTRPQRAGQRVRPILETLEDRTAPATLVYTNDFEAAFGAEWSNTQTDATPQGARSFLGQFGAESVTLTLGSSLFPAGAKAVTVEFDLYLIRSWDGNLASEGPDVFDVSVTNGASLLHTTFSNIPQHPGHNQAFPDPFPGGDHPSRTGATENNTLGYDFFFVESGQVEPSDAVVHMSFTFTPPNGTIEAGNPLQIRFAASGLEGLSDESWGLDNVAVEAHTDVWSLGKDYSLASNPNGDWSYGWYWEDETTPEFHAYPHAHTHGDGGLVWDDPAILSYSAPAVHLNPLTSTAQADTPFPVLPGQVGIHPGGRGEYSVARWTAPTSGSYDVSALITGRDTSPTSANVRIVHNGGFVAPLYAGPINRFGSGPYFEDVLDMQAGDTLDFMVGNAGNGHLSDGTAIDVVIIAAENEEPPPVTGADLSVTIVDAPDPAFVGDQVRYTITVTNHGPEDSTGVVVTSTGPAGGQFGSATFPIGNLASGESRSMQIVLNGAAGTLTTTAEVDANEADPDLSDNTFTATTTVLERAADLAISIAGPAQVDAGDLATYTVTVTNHGPLTATGITLSGDLGRTGNVVEVSGLATQQLQNVNLGTVSIGSGPARLTLSEIHSRLQGTLAPLAPTESAVVTIIVRSVNGRLDLDAAANESDPDWENNTDLFQTEVRPATFHFDANLYSVWENAGSVPITITRTGSLLATAIRLYGRNGSAEAGVDFSGSVLDVPFAQGETTAQVNFPIFDAGQVVDRTFELVLSSGAYLVSNVGSPGTATVTIRDYIPPDVVFESSSSTAAEGGGFHRVNVKLLEPGDQTVTVDVSAIGGPANHRDYLFSSSTVTFEPGQTLRSVSFLVVDDNDVETTEILTLGLANPNGARLGTLTEHIVSIEDNEVPPGPIDRAGNTDATAAYVDLITMPRSFVFDLLRAGDTDVYQVHLHQGDFLALDVDAIPAFHNGQLIFNGVSTSTLVVVGPTGQIASVGRSREPDTGTTNNNVAYGFRAPATGAYYLRLTTTDTAVRGYVMEIHRIAVAEGHQDPAALEREGPMFAGLVGDRMLIRGPTGYGFAIRGPWVKSTTTLRDGRVQATYRLREGAGSVYLETVLGDVPLFSLFGGDQMVVSTKAGVWGATFGEVIGDSIVTRFGVPTLAELLFAELSHHTGGRFALTSEGSFTIQLGQGLGINQLIKGIPYFVARPTAGRVTLDFGDLEVDQAFGSNKLFGAFDPADPMVYLQFEGLPTVSVPPFKFAASLNGQLRFVPAERPTALAAPLTQFYGHVFESADIAISKLITIHGDILADYDANDDGILFGGLGDADAFLRGDLFTPEMIDAVLSDVSFGANGNLVLGVDATFSTGRGEPKEVTLSAQVGSGSAVYNGAEGGLWFRGVRGTQSPPFFAGTPLGELVGSQNDNIEAVVYRDGRFEVIIGTEWKVLGTRVTASATLSNAGVSVDFDGKLKWRVEVPGLGTVTAEANFHAGLAALYDSDTNRVRYTGSVTATGKVSKFSGSIGARVVGRKILFDFPLGIGELEMPLP